MSLLDSRSVCEECAAVCANVLSEGDWRNLILEETFFEMTEDTKQLVTNLSNLTF